MHQVNLAPSCWLLLLLMLLMSSATDGNGDEAEHSQHDTDGRTDGRRPGTQSIKR